MTGRDIDNKLWAGAGQAKVKLGLAKPARER
jgi:hypothetical protein